MNLGSDYSTCDPAATLDAGNLGSQYSWNTGWNLRTPEMGAAGELLRLTGGYIPFAKTKRERLKSGDTRLSIEERYGNFSNYMKEYERAAFELYHNSYLLKEELENILHWSPNAAVKEAKQKHWPSA